MSTKSKNSDPFLYPITFVVRGKTGSSAESTRIRQQVKRLLDSKLAKSLGLGLELDSRLGAGGFQIDDAFQQTKRSK